MLCEPTLTEAEGLDVLLGVSLIATRSECTRLRSGEPTKASRGLAGTRAVSSIIFVIDNGIGTTDFLDKQLLSSRTDVDVVAAAL